MMTQTNEIVFFSPSTGGFYVPSIHGDGIPSDSVRVTAAEHSALIEGQAKGGTISVGAGGFPVLLPPPTPTLEDVKSKAIEKISIFAKGMRIKIAGTSDEIEIAGWNNKLRIATAIQAGTASDADIAAFVAEIESRSLGESMESFVAKVLRNGVFYAQAVGLIDGLKRKAQGAVHACATASEVDAVLTAVKADAETAFAELMKAAS